MKFWQKDVIDSIAAAERYYVLVKALLVLRTNGELTDEIEDLFGDALDDVYKKMSEEDCKEMEARVKMLKLGWEE